MRQLKINPLATLKFLWDNFLSFAVTHACLFQTMRHPSTLIIPHWSWDCFWTPRSWIQVQKLYTTHIPFYILQKQQLLLADSVPGPVFSHVRNGSRPCTTALLCFRYIYQPLDELDHIQFCLGLFTANLVKPYPLPIPKTMHPPRHLGDTQHCSVIPLGHPIYPCALHCLCSSQSTTSAYSI